MKNYKIQIIQISLLTILILIYYISVVNSSYYLSDATIPNSEVIVKYGAQIDTFVSSRTNDSTVYAASKNLELEDKSSIKTTIIGNTVSSDEKGTTYFNNFEEIVAVNDDQTTVYETTLDESVLELIYERQISVSNVHVDQDYYHSVSNVKLESTINYSIDASVITQIKNGKRYDILVYQDVLAISYDEEKNEYYIFYTSSSSSNSISSYNDLVCSKIVWNKKEKQYENDGTQITQGIKLSDQGVLYISPIVTDDSKIVYSKEIGLSDKRILNFYIADFNSKDLKIEDEFLFTSKEVYNEDILEVKNVFVIDDTIYIFFSDLSYTETNIDTYDTKKYIVGKTGKISSISYTHAGGDIYVYFTNEKEINIAKLDEGILTDMVKQSKSELRMGFFDYSEVYDFNVNIDDANKNEKNK